eukprot:CAMPEP_0197189536 /NCGR_PEP_ID=MMETSP1423-20130617/19916_1 /TAXON_ID=476441 /ORGANISM="Pseudo-nitzschia heimii, Strain UNC1101" /LENGTH=192 /DNA_ID=CAMNT_0042641671 /DNA_START=42 /DNA_END=617 /DNA_ORIENTATION=-
MHQGVTNYGGGLQHQQSHSSDQSGTPMVQQQQRGQNNRAPYSQYDMQQQMPHIQYQQQSQQQSHGHLQQTYDEVQRQPVPDGQRIAGRQQPTGVASFDATNQSANITVNLMSDGRPHPTTAPFQHQQQEQQTKAQQEQQQMQQQQKEQQEQYDQTQSHEQTASEVVQEKFKDFLKQAKDNLPTSSKKSLGPN